MEALDHILGAFPERIDPPLDFNTKVEKVSGWVLSTNKESSVAESQEVAEQGMVGGDFLVIREGLASSFAFVILAGEIEVSYFKGILKDV